MFSLNDLIDQQAEKAKSQKIYDLSVIADILPKALKSLDKMFYQAWSDGRILPQKVVGYEKRTLYLKLDSALSLPISYSIEPLLVALNEELAELSIDEIRLVHFSQKGLL